MAKFRQKVTLTPSNIIGKVGDPITYRVIKLRNLLEPRFDSLITEEDAHRLIARGITVIVKYRRK